MSIFLFAIVLLVSLVIIPFGLPGLWVMIGAAVGYDALVTGDPIGWVTLIGVTVIAVIAEVLEFTLAGTYTRRFGGSRRGARGAMIGGVVGAIVGFPIPIVGPLVGAFAGAFLGALVAERTGGATNEDSRRAATGALVGRTVAAAMKVGIGILIAGWLLIAAWM
jgi:uncharacterized protein